MTNWQYGIFFKTRTIFFNSCLICNAEYYKLAMRQTGKSADQNFLFSAWHMHWWVMIGMRSFWETWVREGGSLSLLRPNVPVLWREVGYAVSVLGQHKGYTVKYNPLSEGVTQGQSRRELLKAKGYIWPYIPSQVLIRTLNHLTIIRLLCTSLFSLTIISYTP